jgi:hypothetical protein
MRTTSPFILLPFFLAGSGCARQSVVLPFPRPVAMTVTLQALPDFGLAESKTIEAKEGVLDKVYDLVKPTRILDGGVNKKINPLVATIDAHYADGLKTRMYVRWMGKNPAGVSFDDKQYYWADGGDRGDGAVDLVRLLTSGR